MLSLKRGRIDSYSVRPRERAVLRVARVTGRARRAWSELSRTRVYARPFRDPGHNIGRLRLGRLGARSASLSSAGSYGALAAGVAKIRWLRLQLGDMAHVHHVQVYYEDTDFSGVVYHANYLKFMERAREHLLGVQTLVDMFRGEGMGFVVHKCSLQYLEGARFGERLEVRSSVALESAYRACFQQDVWREGGQKPIVKGAVELCCVDADNRLVALPQWIAERLRATDAYVEQLPSGYP